MMTLPGEVCVYNLRATCSVPAAAVVGTNSTGFESFFLDYDDWDVNT